MPTPTKGPRLGGGPAHERLMLANLATSLFEHDAISALAPATVYGVISLLFLTRARLAWIGRGRRNYGFGG